jgi:hypothetical protein
MCQRVKGLTPRRRCRADRRDVIADLNPVPRGWSGHFKTGDAGKRFMQLDSYVWRRLLSPPLKLHGRNLKPGVAARWTRESFWDLGLYRLRGTVQYRGAA